MNNEISGSHVILNQMRKNDQLARWLFRRGLRPLQLAFFVFIYGLIYSFLLPFLYGELSQALNDWSTLIIILVVMPLLVGYYFWQMQSIQTLFNSLASQITDKKLKQKASLPFAHLFGHPIWFWLSVIIGILQAAYIFYEMFYNSTGWQSHLWIAIAILPLRFIAFYSLVYVITRQTITIVSVNRLLDIYPKEAVLQSGGNAGLFRLGRHTLSIGLLAGLVGLIFGLTLVRIQLGLENYSVEFVLEMIVYLVASPTLFVLPLWKAHLLMERTRNELLIEIEREESAQYTACLDAMRLGKLAGADGERLEALERLSEKTKRLPTWPLDIGIVSRFGAAVILPVLVPVGLNLLTNFVQVLVSKFL